MDPAARSDPNPFSFKSFLKRGDGPPPPPPPASAAAGTASQKTSTKKGSTSRKKGVRKGGLNDAPHTQEDSDMLEG